MLHHTRNISLAGMFTLAAVLSMGGLATPGQAQPLAGIAPGVNMLVQSAPLQTAESHGEARLWLVEEEGGGGSDGGDSFKLLPPNKKMKRRTNIKPLALNPRKTNRRRRLLRARVPQPSFQPTVVKINPNNLRPAPGRPKGPLSVHPGLNPTGKKGGKKGNRKGIATLIPGVTRGVHTLQNPLNVKNTAYARADFSRLGKKGGKKGNRKGIATLIPGVTRGVHTLKNPINVKNRGYVRVDFSRLGRNRNASARNFSSGIANPRGGGSRNCTKMVTVVVDGTPKRVRVSAPGSC